MFFTVSKAVKEMAACMVEHPEDWVQETYEFVNIKHPDIKFWTCNGTATLTLHGNTCFSIAEQFYLAKAIKQSIARRLTEGLK